MATRTPPVNAGVAMVCLAALLLGACGGSSSGPGSGPGPGEGEPQFPIRGGGETTEPPPSVRTARIDFHSEAGERCCVALPIELVPGGALLVLDDLPAGPATLVVAFFAEEFAPAIAEVAATCTTDPRDLGRECDPSRVAAPSFESDPQVVDIVAGGQTNVDMLAIHALPFVFDVTPENGDEVDDPVEFAFTVADAVTGIEEETVDLELTLQVPEGSSFRPLTKRIPLQFTACDDGTAESCSGDDDRDLVGFRARSDPTTLVPGPVEARILALNQGDPPRSVDFEFAFSVNE